MRRSWPTYLIIGGVVILLTVLGGLQYRWLSRISEAENEKAHKQLNSTTEQFAADFNREIQGCYFNFQTEAESWRSKRWGQFNERYDFWHEKTKYPDLITGFYFFTASGDGPLLKYDAEKRVFVSTEATIELTALRERTLDDKNFKPLLADTYTLILPIHEVGPEMNKIVIHNQTGKGSESMVAAPKRYGYLAIKLSESAIKEKILPDLATKYFGDGEYNVSVADRNGTGVFQPIKAGMPDATAPLFDLSPDSFIQFTNKELLSSIGVARRNNVIVNSHVENHTFTSPVGSGANTKTFKIEVQGGEKPRTAMVAGSTAAIESPWTLQIQHASGSLDGAISATLERNLAIGFSILLLLAGAVAVIVISAHRSKILARRQIDFVSSVSHEFRTPLAVIYSAGENLADGIAKEDSQVERYGDLIKGEGRKLSAMVEQILEFAGASSGKQKYNLQETRVADVINDALAECRPLIKEKSIEVESNVPADLPSISVDRRAVSQAIQNLIANSVKYSDGSPWLRIRAEKGDGKVKISIEDRGIGISKNDMRQIFEPFYRSKDVVDAQIHGSGLGLSLVKQIVEVHGGHVSAESEQGEGSRFTIELPQK